MYKKKSKVKTKIGPLFNSEGKLTAKSKEMAEILSQQYVNVFSKPSASQETNNNSTQGNSMPPIVISEELFIKAIDELSPTAAPGPDGFPAILLKNCKTALAKPLVILWTKSIEKGAVPDLLKKIAHYSNPQRGQPFCCSKLQANLADISHNKNLRENNEAAHSQVYEPE